MAVAGLTREVVKMRAAVGGQTAAAPALDALQAEPARIMEQAGMAADPWQTALLRSASRRTLLLCSRQAGKSTTAAALALLTALLTARALVLLLSPSLRQSSELFRKILDVYRAAGRPMPTAGPRDNALRMELANGSRIISLPGTEGTIRGYSGVALLIVDEAARVPDDLYRSVRPMLAVSQGRLVCLSTPFGKRGWFFEEWSGDRAWQRVKITADQCPRIPPAFLAEEREALGPRWYAQEYECSFEDVVGAVFDHDTVMAALASDVSPLFVAG